MEYLGLVTTFAGQGSATKGSTDGVGTNAKFNELRGVAFNPTGTFMYVADMSNNIVRTIDVSTGTKYTQCV